MGTKVEAIPAVHKAGTPLSYDCNEAFVKTTSVVYQTQPATQPRSGPCSGPEVPNGTSIGRPAFHPLCADPGGAGEGPERGHQERFPPPTLSVRCRFGQRTFTGMLRNG